MAISRDKKQAIQERKILQGESRWLQKAMFALSKAGDEREKLAKTRNGAVEAMMVRVGKKSYEIEAVRSAIQDAVEQRMESVRTELRESHAALR